jgi:hypothetical protein
LGLRCPYGAIGDVLWVREAWALYEAPHCPWPDLPHAHANGVGWAFYREGFDRSPPRWRSPIHMPRWASRLTLRVTGVRVERLQDISEEDARREGIDCSLHPGDVECGCSFARVGFQKLWDDLNYDRAPWASNPWVFALDFESLADA